MAGLEGLGMLMKNLDSTYTCPVQAAKHFKLVAELAPAPAFQSRQFFGSPRVVNLFHPIIPGFSQRAFLAVHVV